MLMQNYLKISMDLERSLKDVADLTNDLALLKSERENLIADMEIIKEGWYRIDLYAS